MLSFFNIKNLKLNETENENIQHQIEKERWIKKFAKYWGEKETIEYFELFYEAFVDYEVIWLFFSFLTLVLYKTPLENYLMTIQHYLPFREELRDYLEDYDDNYVVYFLQWWEVLDKPHIHAKLKYNEVAFAELMIKCMLLFIYPLKGYEFFTKYTFDDAVKKMEEIRKKLTESKENTNIDIVKNKPLLSKIEYYLKFYDNIFFKKYIEKHLFLNLEKIIFLENINKDLFYCINFFYRKKIVKMNYENFLNIKNKTNEKEIINYLGEKYFLLHLPDAFFELIYNFTDEFKDLLQSIISGGVSLYFYIKIKTKENDIESIKKKFFNNNYNRYIVFKKFIIDNDTEKQKIYFKKKNTNIINKLITDYSSNKIDETSFVINFLNLFHKDENLCSFFNYNYSFIEYLLNIVE